MIRMSPFEAIALKIVLGIALLGLAYALFLRRNILREDKGTPKMIEVWEAIKQGANAYLTRQLRTILPVIGLLTIVLFFSVAVVPPSAEALERFPGSSPAQVKLIIGLGRAVAFILGALFSLMVGQFGMRMAVQANVRVAAASRKSYDKAMQIAYHAGTITGMLTDGPPPTDRMTGGSSRSLSLGQSRSLDLNLWAPVILSLGASFLPVHRPAARRRRSCAASRS